MLTRDLVLRLCANATEFDEHWLRTDHKVVAPFTAARDTTLLSAIVNAGRAVGVDHLLVCRTRAEHAYEPVTQVPTDTAVLIELIREWGSEPTDFLVVVEDTSAAILVTASMLTVAVGPDDFVRTFVGADIARARIEFADEARLSRDPDLLRAAHHYNCLEQGGRHARGARRGPGPDLAERVHARAARVREGAPRAAAAFGALRGVWGWLLVAVLVLATLFAPGVSATVPLLLGTLWLLAQLALPARSRTVSFAALVRVIALGALMAWPIALVELAFAGAVGFDPEDQYAYAYIAVPVEEIAKFAPLLLCWLVARRQVKRLAAVDFLLLAAAAGAGFHLAEQLMLTAATIGSGTEGWSPGRLGVFALLPGGVELPVEGIRFSGHGVTAALVGGAVGLAVVGRRMYGVWLWLLPPIAIGIAALEHLNYNAAMAQLDPTAVTAFMFALVGNGFATRWLLLLLLVAAVVMDFRIARLGADTTPRLPGRAPLTGLLRWARGRAVRARVRVPGDIAPGFRRVALGWARVPVTLAEAASSMLHEFNVTLVAASRGPDTLFTAWRFLRQRRGFAMGAARAGAKAWRRSPSREELAETETELATAMGVGPRAAGAAAVAAAAVMVPVLLVAPGPGPAAAPENGAYALLLMREATDWIGTLSAAERAWLFAGLASMLGLLVSGWSVPYAKPSLRHFLRAPGRATGSFLGALAPGQVPYGVAALVGMALPKSTDTLLKRRTRPSPPGSGTTQAR
ncbi:RsiW-degrading membrane proteinase PrsW (M82 family) [Murinocardiopsis flavida]|uniref:RsiW-degrading membrane proteinase PrsW (M82 family) n=2 Tax=Murinocardiopsis flavida TaxID=645275 RepID=A0A2P8D6R8_9ACTN|nr:RsiW-degrading membrane proteinase PrsW (M82 family) [Murinocardiopsis flavida]